MGAVHVRPEPGSAGIGPGRRSLKAQICTIFRRGADVRGPDAISRIASGSPKSPPRPKSQPITREYRPYSSLEGPFSSLHPAHRTSGQPWTTPIIDIYMERDTPETNPSHVRPVFAERSKLHEDCGEVAHHTSQKVIPGEPGELRSCPKLASKLSSSCPTSEDVARIRQCLALNRPSVAQIGQNWVNFDQNRPSIDPNWPNVGQHKHRHERWSNVARIRANLAQS